MNINYEMFFFLVSVAIFTRYYWLMVDLQFTSRFVNEVSYSSSLFENEACCSFRSKINSLSNNTTKISNGVAHVAASGSFPIILGGEHSIGFPTVRGAASVTLF